MNNSKYALNRQISQNKVGKSEEIGLYFVFSYISFFLKRQYIQIQLSYSNMGSNAINEQVNEYNNYIEKLKEASAPIKIDINIIEEMDLHQDFFYNLKYSEIIFIPFYKVCKKKVNRFFDSRLASCTSEREGVDKADVGEVYDFLTNRNPASSKAALLSLEDGNNLYYHYLEGKDDFCKYVLDQKVNLRGLAQTAYVYLQCESYIKYIEDCASTVEDRIIAMHLLKEQFPTKNSQELAELVDDNNGMLSIPDMKKYIETVFRLLEQTGITNEEQAIIINILNRECEIPDKYLKGRVNLSDKTTVDKNNPIEKAAPWLSEDYEDPKDLMGIKDVLNGILDKLEVMSGSKLENSQILESFGDPRQYKYRDLGLFDKSNPSHDELDSYLGLSESPNNYKFIIFVNSLANIGYLENTEENLQRFVFRLTGRTLKDRDQMKKSEAVNLLSSSYGKGEYKTSKALWYIIRSICDTKNNGGSRQTIKKKGSIYKKSTRLFAFSSNKNEQRWFTDEMNYKQTSNHQRADDRIKVLLYLLFDVPIKESGKSANN